MELVTLFLFFVFAPFVDANNVTDKNIALVVQQLLSEVDKLKEITSFQRTLIDRQDEVIRSLQRKVNSQDMNASEQNLTAEEVLVLSVDHASGIVGQYFNFIRESIPGLAVYGELEIDAFNSRTGQCGQVVVWGSPNGGSKGNAHGRFNNKPVIPRAGQWRIGDKVVLNYDNCRSAPRTIFHVGILSVDHASGTTGQYFNFMRTSIPGLEHKAELKFNAINPRTGAYGQVVVWGGPNGVSIGDAHGRFDSVPVAPRPGQWKSGDILIVMM